MGMFSQPIGHYFTMSSIAFACCQSTHALSQKHIAGYVTSIFNIKPHKWLAHYESQNLRLRFDRMLYFVRQTNERWCSSYYSSLTKWEVGLLLCYETLHFGSMCSYKTSQFTIIIVIWIIYTIKSATGKILGFIMLSDMMQK